MILNGHFALKSVLGSAFGGLRVLAFGQNCSEICRAKHLLSAAKCSPESLLSGS